MRFCAASPFTAPASPTVSCRRALPNLGPVQSLVLCDQFALPRQHCESRLHRLILLLLLGDLLLHVFKFLSPRPIKSIG
jgi:hypothetical protein